MISQFSRLVKEKSCGSTDTVRAEDRCVPPVGLQVLETGLQVVQQVDLFAALGTVNVHEILRVVLTHLSRGLARAVDEAKRPLLRPPTRFSLIFWSL